MFLDGNAALHIVDTATDFSADTFLGFNGKSSGKLVDGS